MHPHLPTHLERHAEPRRGRRDLAVEGPGGEQHVIVSPHRRDGLATPRHRPVVRFFAAFVVVVARRRTCRMVTRIDIHHRRTTQEMGDIVPSTTKRYLPQQHYVTSWSVPIAKNYLSLTQGRLARETLAIKWRGLCDIMLVWYLPYCTSLKHLRMGCSFLVPAIDESNFVPAGKAVSQTPLSAAGRAPPPKNVLWDDSGWFPS